MEWAHDKWEISVLFRISQAWHGVTELFCHPDFALMHVVHSRSKFPGNDFRRAIQQDLLFKRLAHDACSDRRSVRLIMPVRQVVLPRRRSRLVHLVLVAAVTVDNSPSLQRWGSQEKKPALLRDFELVKRDDLWLKPQAIGLRRFAT